MVKLGNLRSDEISLRYFFIKAKEILIEIGYVLASVQVGIDLFIFEGLVPSKFHLLETILLQGLEDLREGWSILWI